MNGNLSTQLILGEVQFKKSGDITAESQAREFLESTHFQKLAGKTNPDDSRGLSAYQIAQHGLGTHTESIMSKFADSNDLVMRLILAQFHTWISNEMRREFEELTE